MDIQRFCVRERVQFLEQNVFDHDDDDWIPVVVGPFGVVRGLRVDPDHGAVSLRPFHVLLAVPRSKEPDIESLCVSPQSDER